MHILRFLTIVVMALTLSLNAHAKDDERSYNFQRGLEALQNENYEDALKYLEQEVQDNKKNGECWYLLAAIHYRMDNQGAALSAAGQAIKLLKKDKERLANSYRLRAKINEEIEEPDAALADYGMALRTLPNTRTLLDRAQLFYALDRYDESDADYLAASKMDAGEAEAYVGLGRNASEQGRMDEAIKQFDYALKLQSDYPAAYLQRARAYHKMKKWPAASDDLVSSLSYGMAGEDIAMIDSIAHGALTILTTKLQAKALKEPNKSVWPAALGFAYGAMDRYGKAADAFRKAYEIEPDANGAYRVAQAEFERGYYKQAIDYLDKALDLDSTAVALRYIKAAYAEEGGMLDEALSYIEQYIKQQPDDSDGYMVRAGIKNKKKDYEGAVADYTTAINMDADNAQCYVSRGRIYLKQQKQSEAEADFKKALEIDADTTGTHLAPLYARILLGQNDSARIAADKLVAKEASVNNLYNAACVYALMGEKPHAIDLLRQAMEKGYRHFAHLKADSDLDALRDEPDFKALVKKYEQAYNDEIDAAEAAEAKEEGLWEEKVVEVPFKKEGGVMKVKCTINNLPLHFIFDTGASDVTMSNVEAAFMMKNDYLSSKDVVGRAAYQTASGDISEGTVINLSKVNFYGLELENVRASIVKSQSAPLLLGMSVLKKLGRVELDNGKGIIRITHKVKKQQ